MKGQSNKAKSNEDHGYGQSQGEGQTNDKCQIKG